jgi:hypothetical protein
MPVTNENVVDVFSYHAPKPGQPEIYENIRRHGLALAEVILSSTKPCGDQQAALRLLRESVMTANAAVALDGAV